MHKWIPAVLMGFMVMSSHASLNPDGLIKVTPQTKPQCVEYYIYANSIYCSNKVLQKTAVDPELYRSEKQQLHFDDRVWQAVWGKKSSDMTTIEYIPAGDSINNWHELVTTHFIADPQNTMDIASYYKSFVNNLEQTGLKPEMIIHEQHPDMMIFEFKINSPTELIQDELQKVSKHKDGIYVIHYVIKEKDMGDKNRALWIKNLQDSSIKKDHKEQ